LIGYFREICLYEKKLHKILLKLKLQLILFFFSQYNSCGGEVMNNKGNTMLEITVVLAIIGMLFILTPLQLFNFNINSMEQELMIDIGMIEGIVQQDRLNADGVDIISELPEFSLEYLLKCVEEKRIYDKKGIVLSLDANKSYHNIVSLMGVREYRTEFNGEWFADPGGSVYYISHVKSW
jgi:type II secretory pathway pseudopilin PulG